MVNWFNSALISSLASSFKVFSYKSLSYVVRIIFVTSARCFFKKSVNTFCLIQASYDLIFYIRLISNNTGFSWQKQLKNNKICVIIFINLLITNHIFSGGLISCTIHSHNKNLNLTLTDTTAKMTA